MEQYRMETVEFEKKEAAREFLFLTMTIGEYLLESGAEVSRVEDTIRRICMSYGALRVDAFVITTSIIVTMAGETFGVITQTRRIHGMEYNLTRLEELNQLSRRICNEHLTLPEIHDALDEIGREHAYSFDQLVWVYALVSASFSMFFGGDWLDAVASAVIGVGLKYLLDYLKRLEINSFVRTFACACAGGLVAFIFVTIGFGHSVDMISIGNIMLLVPGIAMTNGIRDMFEGDTISGLLRFAEAMLLAMILAFGFALVSFL